MRVLVFTNMYPTSEEPWRGCFVKDLADNLRRLGLDLSVFHFDGRNDRRNYVRAAVALRARVKREAFDLIHAHYGLSGAAAMVQRREPVVTTFHGPETAWPGWQRRVSWCVARATTPVFVSREGAADLGCLGAPVIPNGVDLELFRPKERREARRQLAWSLERRYILFPGVPANPIKRYDLFTAAVRAGQAHVPDLTPVTLEGLSRSEVATVMNAVDVTLLTSDKEGAPVSIKESLACTTPIVSVPVGDVGELIEGLTGCVIAPREPEALVRGILAALDAGRDPALRRRVERFSARKTAERTLALYESVLAD
jgi:teichuronic acid biosynthesis glycosyltransferase TuaC